MPLHKRPPNACDCLLRNVTKSKNTSCNAFNLWRTDLQSTTPEIIVCNVTSILNYLNQEIRVSTGFNFKKWCWVFRRKKYMYLLCIALYLLHDKAKKKICEFTVTC